MFKIIIENTDNAAFCDPNTGEKSKYYETIEIARIVNEIKARIDYLRINDIDDAYSCYKNSHNNLHDINGNIVGFWQWK